MTILPKKKSGKEKTDAENSDHSLGHHSLHPGETRHDKPNRGRTSPTRWLPGATREDKHQNHDPGGGFDSLGHDITIAGLTSHNKRRHRSSPHRSHVRKHRSNTSHAPTPTTHVTAPPVAPEVEYDETENNSGDEYVSSQQHENIEEV